jgi:hypothetical protein
VYACMSASVKMLRQTLVLKQAREVQEAARRIHLRCKPWLSQRCGRGPRRGARVRARRRVRGRSGRTIPSSGPAHHKKK